MQKVLIVGLGGSGGKTLAYIMDELKVRLGESWNGELPKCWKFVQIDVPVSGGLAGSTASPVPAQGGTYVGLADSGSPYPEYDQSVMGVLQAQNPSSLDLVARWRPDPIKASAIAISGGAGAYRAVGRMVTVAKASNIFTALKSALTDLQSNEASNDLAKLESELKAPVFSAEQEPPIVLMVSSLAGGSGASMVLDVADMLRGLSVSGGGAFDGEHAAAFLYTSDVFASLGIKSGGPGSLATISELISAMSRQGEPWNKKEWEALGIGGAAVPAATGRGPHMIFPVGSKVNGVPFGVTPDDIFRGFARTLAPIFINPKIQFDFYQYVQVNGYQAMQAAGDKTGLATDPMPASGSGLIPSGFSGWGSSVLTMGRDRYTEYSAQRIARKAVEVLVNGYQNDAFVKKTINLQQAVQQGAAAIYPTFLKVAGLENLSTMTASDFGKILGDEKSQVAFGQSQAEAFKTVFTGKDGPSTAASLASEISKKSATRDAAISSEALKTVLTWTTAVQTKIEDAFLYVSAQLGLLIANECLTTMMADMNRLQVDLEVDSAVASSMDTTLKQAFDAAKALGKTQITSVHPYVARFNSRYGEEVRLKLDRDIKFTLAEILPDFRKNFVSILIDSANHIWNELNFELGKDGDSTITAAYREAYVSQWPADGNTVPRHFTPAVNEVLIDGVSQFPNFFDTHVAQAVLPVVSDQVAEAARQILTRVQKQLDENGDFSKVAGWTWKRTPLGSHPNISRSRNWQGRQLSTVDGQPQAAAAFDLKLTWKDILEHARTWVSLPSCSFRQHQNEGISEWLNPADGISAQVSAERLSKVQQKLFEAITTASPLVDIDNAAVQKIHGSNFQGNLFEFSVLPFDSKHPVIQQTQKAWSSQPTAAQNSAALTTAAQGARGISEVFIYGTTASPYLPMAFRSLTEPIRNEWSSAVANGSEDQFWQWRRARALRHFVPMSQRHIAAFLQGWTVGRITGQIQLVDSNDGSNGRYVQVTDKNGATLDFPRKLLGFHQKHQLGVEKKAHGQNESNWNVPAALLESLGLAMASCQGLDTSPIDPYLAVIELGATLKSPPPEGSKDPVGGPANVLSPLDKWFSSGAFSGFESQVLSAQGATGEERRANAIGWLENVCTYMGNLVSTQITSANLETINREYEIAPEVILACQAVIRELNRSELGTAIDDSGRITTLEQNRPEATSVSGGTAVEG
jgi:hypothetical protein